MPAHHHCRLVVPVEEVEDLHGGVHFRRAVEPGVPRTARIRVRGALPIRADAGGDVAPALHRVRTRSARVVEALRRGPFVAETLAPALDTLRHLVVALEIIVGAGEAEDTDWVGGQAVALQCVRVILVERAMRWGDCTYQFRGVAGEVPAHDPPVAEAGAEYPSLVDLVGFVDQIDQGAQKPDIVHILPISRAAAGPAVEALLVALWIHDDAQQRF
eukprot:gene10874-biopygen10682